MTIHRSVFASVLVACALTGSAAFAQQTPKAQQHKDTTKHGTNAADATEAQDAKDAEAAKHGNSAEPSRDGTTDSKKQVKPQTTTVAGQKAVNKDEDLDMAVGKTETTAADPARRDVIESRAEARREGEGRRVTAAPLAGYGFNDLGVGVGARAGYTFDTPVYVGGTFMYHNGTNDVVNRPGVTNSSAVYMYPGVEVGYDIGIGPVLLRPYAGAGLLVSRVSVGTAAGENTETESAVMVYPGATAHYIIGKSPVFVGADARVLLPFENQGVSPTLMGTAGLHL